MILLYGIALAFRIAVCGYAIVAVTRISRVRLLAFLGLAVLGTVLEVFALALGLSFQGHAVSFAPVAGKAAPYGMQLACAFAQAIGHPAFLAGVSAYSLTASGFGCAILRAFAGYARTARSMIHRLQRQRRSLRRLRAREEAVLAALPDSLYYVAFDGTVLGIWSGPEASGDARQGDRIGRPLAEFFPAVAQKLLGHVEAACLTRQLQELEYSFVSGSGVWIQHEARIAPVGGRDAIVMLRDVTRQKELQRELLHRDREKDELLARREALLRELQHRVKNTLQVALGVLDLQKLKSDNPEARRLLQQSEDRIRTIAQVQESLSEAPDASRCRLDECVRSAVENAWMAAPNIGADVRPEWTLQATEAHLDAALPLALLAGLMTAELAGAFAEQASRRAAVLPRNSQTTARLEIRLESSADSGELRLELRLRDPVFASMLSDLRNGADSTASFQNADEARLDAALQESLARQLGGEVVRHMDDVSAVCELVCNPPEFRPIGTVRTWSDGVSRL